MNAFKTIELTIAKPHTGNGQYHAGLTITTSNATWIFAANPTSTAGGISGNDGWSI